MKKIARDLQRAGSEMQAAMSLKTASLSDRDFLGVLERAGHGFQSKSSAASRLRPATVYALQTRVAGCSNAFYRHAGLEILSKLGPLDRSLVAQMYMQYGDHERALAAGALEALDESVFDGLIASGAVHELYAFCAQLPLEDHQWHQILELFISRGLYTYCKDFWPLKPRKVSQWIVRQLALLAAKHKDLEFVLELEPLLAVRQDPVLARHIFALVEPRYAIEALEIVGKAGGDGEGSPLLSAPLSLSFRVPAGVPAGSTSITYNASLQHALDNYTSLYVFALYRSYRFLGLVPNELTWYILSKACFRLGNSKQLAYEIWREHEALGITPSRRVAESLLLSQLQGLGCQTALWMLAQMHKHKIYLRNHIHFRLLKAFEPSTTYKQIFGDIRRLEAYRDWDPALAAAEAGKYARQSERNCRVYLEGGDLDKMLEFEKINT